jgi:hypothetical protein
VVRISEEGRCETGSLVTFLLDESATGGQRREHFVLLDVESYAVQPSDQTFSRLLGSVRAKSSNVARGVSCHASSGRLARTRATELTRT